MTTQTPKDAAEMTPMQKLRARTAKRYAERGAVKTKSIPPCARCGTWCYGDCTAG